jgi:hypothetical protein
MSDANVPATPVVTPPATGLGAVPAVPVPIPSPDLERRAAGLAAAKRAGAKVQAEREKLNQQAQAQAARLEKADRLEHFEKLLAEDPLKFAREVGIDVGDLARRHIEASTGSKQTPAELVRQEVDRRLTEDRAAQQKQAAETEAKRQAEWEAQTYAGVKRQMADIVKADPVRFELVGRGGPAMVEEAFKRIADDFEANSKNPGFAPLAFDKALDSVEADIEKEQMALLSQSAKVKSAWEKFQTEAKKAAAPPVPSAKTRSAEAPRHVETEAPPSPSLTPRTRRRPLDIRQMASEMWDQHKAKQDN